MRRMGKRQLGFLFAARDAEGQAFQFKPVGYKPPAPLRGLIAKGLMWAERRDVVEWMPQKQQWKLDRRPGSGYWCGLTDKGRQVLKEIHQKAQAEADARDRRRADISRAAFLESEKRNQA